MKLQINKNFINYIIITMFTLLDSLLLCFINNNILFIFYIILNVIILTLICNKKETDDCIIFAILYMLFYTYFIDTFIHYFKLDIIFDAEYLYCIPLLISFIKTKNKNSKIFFLISIIYILINLLILIFSKKVDALNYISFLPYILTFIAYYCIFKNITITEKFKDLYKYIFVLCLPLTLGQTAVGFNQDTRNGIFSVFGWGAYTIFIMFYALYSYAKYLNKKTTILKLAISLLICCLLYICTESKAAIVIMFVSIIVMTMINKKITLKHIIIFLTAISLIPISFNLLIKFNPKFSYLNNISSIIRYYTGNNDWRYQYGRFEALSVAYNNLDDHDKILGAGFGSAVPLNYILYNEANMTIHEQYYIKMYGYRHGFQNTSTAIAILDGGLIFLALIILFLINIILNTIKNITSNKNSAINLVKIGMLVYILYIFIYSNIFKDFRYMAIIGLVLGMNNISFSKKSNKIISIKR